MFWLIVLIFCSNWASSKCCLLFGFFLKNKFSQSQLLPTTWLLAFWVGIEHLQGWRLHSLLGQHYGPPSSQKLPPNDLLLERKKDGLHGAFLSCAWIKAPHQQRVGGEISLQSSVTAANQCFQGWETIPWRNQRADQQWFLSSLCPTGCYFHARNT